VVKIKDAERAMRILEILEKNMEIKKEEFTALASEDPFEILIATILSQNTNDRNSLAAFNELKRRIGINPDSLSKAEEDDIADAIRIAGLYRTKARAIKEIAREVEEKYGGDFRKVLSLENPRDELLKLPKVGEKTADVVLLFSSRMETFPIDTHVRRVAGRLGLSSGSYEEMRRDLMSLFKGKCLEAHLLLIQLGRRYCRARKPLCSTCPVRSLCPTGMKGSP
jgi:endonuclease-3